VPRAEPGLDPSTPAPSVGGETVDPVPVGQPTGEPDLLVVGRIGKPQGIKGEVTVQVRTDDPDARFAVGAVLLTDPAERGPLRVATSRSQNGRLMVGFEGVADRNDAELLRETLLQVDARTLPPPEDEDEFHDHVLRGMTARLVSGDLLGEVVDVLHLPHGDVLVVRRADNAAEVLVPFVRAMVPEVDVAARSLLVDPPEGLLDLTDTPSTDDVATDDAASDDPATDDLGTDGPRTPDPPRPGSSCASTS
jgi:16S rRNA processing protein RimM